jgi:cardiolipin synthase
MRYWDFSIPSAEVHPTTVSKYNTFLQLILIGSTLVLPIVTDSMLPGSLTNLDVANAVTSFQHVVAGTTLWSGASYVWRKDVVRILGKDEALKKKQGFRGRMIIGLSFTAFIALALELWRREKTDEERS